MNFYKKSLKLYLSPIKKLHPIDKFKSYFSILKDFCTLKNKKRNIRRKKTIGLHSKYIRFFKKFSFLLNSSIFLMNRRFYLKKNILFLNSKKEIIKKLKAISLCNNKIHLLHSEFLINDFKMKYSNIIEYRKNSIYKSISFYDFKNIKSFRTYRYNRYNRYNYRRRLKKKNY